jgi:hypothetical protein
MSNCCANIINRLVSDVYRLKEREATTGLMFDVLQINQALIQNSDTTVYLLPAQSTIPGIPITLNLTTYNATDKTCTSTTGSFLVTLQKVSSCDCIVYTTKCLSCYGSRDCCGFYCFNSTPMIYVMNIDPTVLSNASKNDIYSALQYCANKTFDCFDPCVATLTCDAYDLLVNYLCPYGISKLNVFQAACIYKYLAKINGNPCNPDCFSPAEPNEPPVGYTETVAELHNEQVVEQSEAVTNVYVRQLKDTTISEQQSNNESIEAKLKALLEATETSEQTE